jgi:uncharacterized membrane protein
MLHLFHPALVHFSVAFLGVGGTVEAFAILTRRERAARWGGRLLLIGLVSLLPTIVSGYLAANTVALPPGGEVLLARHERNGLLLLAVTLLAQFWKAWCGGRVPQGPDRLYALMLIVAVGLTAYGAWLGGRMVYGQGIGVR